MNKSSFMRQMILLNNSSRVLGTFAFRNFYYPDANHHHLNQEVSEKDQIMLIISESYPDLLIDFLRDS